MNVLYVWEKYPSLFYMYTDATCVSGRQSSGPGDTAIPDSWRWCCSIGYHHDAKFVIKAEVIT